VTATVTYTFKPVAAFGVIPPSITLTRTVQMRVAPQTPAPPAS
jgi:hypothetical protein